MHILYLTPEVTPFSGTGVLAETAAALPRALQEAGHQVTLITPFYRGISADRYSLAHRIRKVDVTLGGKKTEIGILDGKLAGCDVALLFVEHPESFDREAIYGDGHEPHADNHRRFFLFCQAALALVEELGLEIDLIHANGWPSGFLPLLVRQGAVPPSARVPLVFSAHDDAADGLFPPAILDELHLGYDLFHPEGIEFHGQVSLLKAALLYADLIVEKSPSHVAELRTAERGGGLHGVWELVAKKTVGILPGVDPSWSPRADHRIAALYSAEDLAGKATCKQALQETLDLTPRFPGPLLTLLGDLGPRSGLELVLRAAPQLLAGKVQLALLGEVDPGTAARIQELQGAHPQTLGHRRKVSDEAIHRFLAGSDALLVPATTGSGGLHHLKALRFGTIPVVRALGGLQDTVVDFDPATRTGTGLCFQPYEEDALLGAVNRLVGLHHDQELWVALQGNAMRQSFSWELTAQRHLEAYERLLADRR